MSDDADPAARAATYLEQAEAMRLASEKVFDPFIAAQYVALAARWLKLAEQAQRGTYITTSAADREADRPPT
jgi:hypothetical protein